MGGPGFANGSREKVTGEAREGATLVGRASEQFKTQVGSRLSNWRVVGRVETSVTKNERGEGERKKGPGLVVVWCVEGPWGRPVSPPPQDG